MSWRVRLNEHFPGGNTNIALGGGLTVRDAGDGSSDGTTESPPDVYPDVAPDIGATRFTELPFVEGTLTITKALDGTEYEEGVDFEENAPDSWTNLTIIPGTGIIVHYFIESSLESASIQLQLEGDVLPNSSIWNLLDGFDAELNPSTGAIDITALGGGGGGTDGLVEGITAFTLLNGWTADSLGFSPGYYMDRERVWLRGRMQGGTVAVGTVLCALPTGYRPTSQITFLAAGDNAPVPIDVQADGDVVIADSAFLVGTDWLSLDGLSFRIVDTSTAVFQDWGQTDVSFGTPDMDVPYGELP